MLFSLRDIIPVQAEYLPAKGLEQLLQTVNKVKRQINPKLQICLLYTSYEINRDFKPIIREKLGVSQLTLGDDAKVIFAEDDIGNISSFEQLPYLFNDPHRMDKKIDVKKLQFGSRIDQSESKREELFSVKKVISPDKIELSNGLTVRLLGIKPNPLYQGEAISFLQEKFQKRKVFLKYDAIKYDAENNLMCYVYLDNKTFINNHLVRTGFVDVDTSFDYTYQKKFLNSFPN